MVGRAVVAKSQTDATKQRRHRHILQANRPEVVAVLATGTQPADVARLYNVAVSTVTRFAEKYAEPIAAMRAEVIRQVEDYAIAHKVNRVAALDKLYTDIDAWIEEHSLTERTVRWDEDGNEVGEVLRFRSDAVNALRGVLKDAATELGQLPRPDNNTTVNVGILVRQLAGYNPEDIG
jgi:hypothetical protein